MRADAAGLGIAILGWGSLVWDPRTLRIATPWELTDLRLPLEFSRISKDQRLTLVIDTKNGVDCCVYSAISSITSLTDAVADLAEREGTDPKNIAVARAGAEFEEPDPRRRIETWRQHRGLTAVIWTDLEPNFMRKRKKVFTVEEALAHLVSLHATEREGARRYIVNAPNCVRTPLRMRLIDEGWI